MMVAVGQASGSSDSKNDMAKAITNVTIVNSILIIIMTGMAFFYLAENKEAVIPYLIIMVHVSLLMSVISVSISSLQQISSS